LFNHNNNQDKKMALLVNQAGRYVEVEENVEYWIQQPGFRQANPQEEKDYRAKRLYERAKSSGDTSYRESLFFTSVSTRGGADGYGMSSLNLVESMKNAGIDISEYYTEQDIGLLYHSPHQITQLPTRYKIVFTMFESDKIPDDWVDYLHAADLVIVPSKWCQSVFKKAGVKSIVVPLGYNDSVFKYVNRPDRKIFTFLHYDAFNTRKGHFEVLEAFDRAFEPTEPVRLVFKTTREHLGVPLNKGAYPNIDVIQGKMTEQELANICFDADAFVFPSRGEGFGCTPLEAMATGLPTIVPNAHGISEYFDKRYMYGVKATEKCTAIYRRLTDVGNMVKADVDDLAKVMRWVYENPEKAKAKGKLASDYVKQYTISKTGKRLKEIIDDVRSKPLPERKISDILPLQEV